MANQEPKPLTREQALDKITGDGHVQLGRESAPLIICRGMFIGKKAKGKNGSVVVLSTDPDTVKMINALDSEDNHGHKARRDYDFQPIRVNRALFPVTWEPPKEEYVVFRVTVSFDGVGIRDHRSADGKAQDEEEDKEDALLEPNDKIDPRCALLTRPGRKIAVVGKANLYASDAGCTFGATFYCGAVQVFDRVSDADSHCYPEIKKDPAGKAAALETYEFVK